MCVRVYFTVSSMCVSVCAGPLPPESRTFPAARPQATSSHTPSLVRLWVNVCEEAAGIRKAASRTYAVVTERVPYLKAGESQTLAPVTFSTDTSSTVTMQRDEDE